jgi:hypothetical protein
MNLFHFILKGIKKIGLGLNLYSINKLILDAQEEEANDLIRSKLLSDKPCMICRYGSAELYMILQCESERGSGNIIQKSLKYLSGDIYQFWIDKKTSQNLSYNAGFYPATKDNFRLFSELMLEESQYIDILGSWVVGENYLLKYFKNAKIIKLRDLEPYYHKNPWSTALKNKKVLVIHPFSKTIQNQYKNRKKIFEDENILPKFTLLTYKPIQSISDTKKLEFKTWFLSLEKMKRDISKIDFDIAIIGAGAYGFPLASHIKKMGKKSIHLGGATQILFGIKGKRWEEKEFFINIFNKNWVRPSEDERPKGFNRVENGCYW